MGLTGPARPRPAQLAVALLSLSLLLAACSPSDQSGSTTTTGPSVPKGYQLKTDSTVTIAVRALPSNFNPNTPAGDNQVTQMVMAQVWPSPFVTTSSFALAGSAMLVSAEVHAVAPLEVVYQINPKAAWSDGTPITATDFVYDWHERLQGSAGLPDAGVVAGYRDIASIIGTNAGRTVTVTFKQPFSQWQELFSYLPPAQVGQRLGWERAFASFSPERVLSGGPFEITSYRPGHELTLSRNRSYWGPAPTIARIRFVVEPSSAAMLAGLERGRLSLAELPAAVPAPGVLGAGAVGMEGAARAIKARGGRRNLLAWTGGLSNRLWQLCFNLDDPLTANLLLRRGIEHAIDRSTVVAASEDLVDPRVHVAVSRLLVSGETSATGTSDVARAPDLYQPSAALRAFRQAGYSLDGDGLMRAAGTGPPLVLDLLEPAGDWAVDQAGLVIQSELGAIGVRLVIKEVPLGSMLEHQLPQGNYEMALAPFSVGGTIAALLPEYSNPVLPPRYPAGPTSPAALHSSGTLPSSGPSSLWSTPGSRGTEPGALAVRAVTRDVLGFESAAVDSYFAQALAALDPPVELADLEKAEAVLWRDVVTIPLFQTGVELVRSARLENVSDSPTPAGPMWDAQQWAILKQLPAPEATTTSSP